MKLEVGGEYRTRDGEKAVIFGRAQDSIDAWPLKGVVGGLSRSWTYGGRAGYAPEIDSIHDIVAEWEEPASNQDSLRDLILATFENPESWPMTDGQRIALLRRLYRIAKNGGAE